MNSVSLSIHSEVNQLTANTYWSYSRGEIYTKTSVRILYTVSKYA